MTQRNHVPTIKAGWDVLHVSEKIEI